uniref:Uncharacterized protein n=1 Tax=Arundo donax TaxID=35708 RepID=A0A0A9BXY2_ARUDO
MFLLFLAENCAVLNFLRAFVLFPN